MTLSTCLNPLYLSIYRLLYYAADFYLIVDRLIASAGVSVVAYLQSTAPVRLCRLRGARSAVGGISISTPDRLSLRRCPDLPPREIRKPRKYHILDQPPVSAEALLSGGIWHDTVDRRSVTYLFATRHVHIADFYNFLESRHHDATVSCGEGSFFCTPIARLCLLKTRKGQESLGIFEVPPSLLCW